MTNEFIQNALSRSSEGQQWLDRIPTIIKECEQKWRITTLPPFNLSYNYVAPARMLNGSEVVLKIGFPKDYDFISEIEALKILTVKVLRDYWNMIKKILPS